MFRSPQSGRRNYGATTRGPIPARSFSDQRSQRQDLLVRNKDTFALMVGGADPDYKVHIVDATVFPGKVTQIGKIPVSSPHGELCLLHNKRRIQLTVFVLFFHTFNLIGYDTSR